MRDLKVRSIVEQVTGCSELMDYEASDGGNADALVWLYGNEFLYVEELGWLHWNGKYWEQDTASLYAAIEDTLMRRRTEAVTCEEEKIVEASKRNKYRVEGAEFMLQSRLRAKIEEFDSDPDKINVANGVIDFETGELIPHDPSQRFTYVAPVGYYADSDSSQWEAFLQEAVTPAGEEPDQELLDFIQQAMGYSFTGHTREERLFYIYGPTRSGKGTFTEAILKLIPRPISMEVDFNTFTAKRDGNDQNFDLADMKPSRIVFASESNKYQSLNPGKIKQLTGGNYTTAAFKHKDRFSYRPQYTVWLSSNHKAMGDPEDDALWYRVLVIEFPNSHAGHEDTTLKERLKSESAQQGILKWIVDGAIRWYASERLHIPERVKLATQAHRNDLDYIALWLEDVTESDPESFTPASELYHSYETWCKANGVEPKKMKELGQALTRRGYLDKGPVRRDGKLLRGRTGIKITHTFFMQQ
jgi:putative DNA primase/helicase